MKLNEKSQLIELVQEFCRDNKTDFALTMKYLQAVCQANDVKSLIPFCKSVLNRVSEEEIIKLRNGKRYFDGIFFVGFERDEFNRLLLELIENHCIKNFPITYEEIDELNKTMAKFCQERGINKYETLVGFALKSRTLSKCNIPINELRMKAQKQLDEWNKLLEEIESEEEE